MGGESPATSTVSGTAESESEKLSFGRQGLRRLFMCRVDSTLLAWLQTRSGSEAPGAIGEVLARAVAEGVPSLQTKGLPPNSQSESAPGDADGGRLVAFSVDSSLVQQLAEIAGDAAPAVVRTTAIAAAMEAASLSGGRKRTSTRKRRTTTTRRQTKAAATTAAPGKAKAADTAEATAPAAKAAPRKKGAARQSRRTGTSRRSAQAKQPQLQALAPDVAAALEAGECSSPLLRALRQSLGLSQAAAAQSLGVSRGLVADAERGRRAGQQTLSRLIGGLRRVRAECEEAVRKKAESESA